MIGKSRTYACLLHHLFRVCLNIGCLTAPLTLTVSPVLALAGYHLNKQSEDSIKCYTSSCDFFRPYSVICLLILRPLTWGYAEPENIKWWVTFIGYHCLPCLSFATVSNSGKSWPCSQDAQLPHDWLFIVVWRRCCVLAPGRTLSWRRCCPAAQQPQMLLPG